MISSIVRLKILLALVRLARAQEYVRGSIPSVTISSLSKKVGIERHGIRYQLRILEEELIEALEVLSTPKITIKESPCPKRKQPPLPLIMPTT